MAETTKRQRWELVREVFGGALERESGEWTAYLRRVCAGDRKLEAEVASLLEAHRQGGDFLAGPEALADDRAPAGDRAPATDDAAVLGRRLGAYRIERRIGRGGMGAVYLAARADAAFDKQVAIKLLKSDMAGSAVARRLRAERRILAGLEHPNIARLLDGGTAGDGRPYLVMEHVEGSPIDDYCNAHQLSVRERIELFRKVCAAVQYAHRNLVVHRDLKPSNILVTAGGEPKLLDFGIAKILDQDSSRKPAGPAETVLRLMTPDYASPEQVLCEPVTTLSDVYALGVLLYLLLTGRHPLKLESDSPVEVLWAIRNLDPEPPSRAARRPLRRRLAGDLDNIVLKALRKEPERRYATVDQLSEDLRHHLAGRPVSASADSLAYRCAKFVRRHRLGVATAVVFCLAVLGFGIVMAFQRSEIARERDRLAEQRQATELERLRAERVTAFLIDLFETSDPFSSPVDARDVTARELLDRGAERLARLEAEPAARADLSHTIGVIYRRLGLSDDARPLLEQALETRRAAGDPAKLADSLDQEGLLLRDAGDYAAAEARLRESLALRRARLGARHPAVAESLGHLAELAEAAGDFEAAERQQRAALEIARESLGDDHAAVASGLRQLAVIVLSRGDHGAAEELYSQALAIQLRLFGERHPQVARTRYGLAELVLRRGDYAGAEVLYRQALETMRRRLGDDHVEVAFAVHSLALVRAGQGDLETAADLYREALAALETQRGPEHPDLAATLHGLGRVLLDQEDFTGAERCYLRAFEIRRRALGEGSPHLAISLTGLGRVAIARGDFAAAEDWLRQAIDIGRRAFPGGHWRIDAAQSLLGTSRLKAGRLAEAEPLLLGSYQALKSRRGERALVTLTALDRLIELYERRGNAEEAAKYRAERQRAGADAA